MRILCFGDSLTAGCTWGGTYYHPYLNRLSKRLKEAFPAISIETEEDGENGDVTKNFSVRLMTNLQQNKGKPYDWVIILGGTNDLAYDYKPDAIFQNLERTWINAFGRKAKVLALTVPEIFIRSMALLGEANSKRDRLNALILGYNHRHFHAYDLQSDFSLTAMSEKERRLYWDDGVHLTPAGHDLMGDKIADAFIKILNREAELTTQQTCKISPRSQQRYTWDDRTDYDEEGGSPRDLSRGYIVVRRKDLD